MTPRRGLTISDIIHTASNIADDQGLKQLSIGALAEKLKIKPPSLYNHVRGLDELHDLLAVYGCQKLLEKLEESILEVSKEDAVKQFSYAYVTFAKEHPGLYEATSRAAEEENVEIKQAQEQIVLVILRVLEAFDLENEHAIHVIRMLRSMLHGFVTLEQEQGFGLPYDLDQTLEVMIRTFLKGLTVTTDDLI
ncbi:TetR-like C-terminal domain-containing protein [Alkalicoccobacillus gibsonii]|uniref:TetR-like C-terminal domain-containing protein n=1 Tax=Alkalicoccobacillus gibsonii TaxID=79881 RepID=A0ABU9VDZ0_9BACI